MDGWISVPIVRVSKQAGLNYMGVTVTSQVIYIIELENSSPIPGKKSSTTNSGFDLPS